MPDLAILAHLGHWYHWLLYVLPVGAVLVAIALSVRRGPHCGDEQPPDDESPPLR